MNKKLKKILIITGWIVTIGIVGFLIYNVQKRNKELVCRNLIIDMDSIKTFNFVSETQIYKVIADSVGVLVGKPLNAININRIEQILAYNPYLKNITVYKTLQGDVKIEFAERKPLIHVFTKNNEQFYIDNDGVLIPTSEDYTSNVGIALGEIYEVYSEKLDLKNPASINNYPVMYKTYIVSEFLSKDKFWEAMIDQVYINKKNEIELIPKMGKHRIIIGNIDNLEKKFEDLMVFYKKVIMKTGWDTYETIDLRFNNQIVCSINKTQ